MRDLFCGEQFNRYDRFVPVSSCCLMKISHEMQIMCTNVYKFHWIFYCIFYKDLEWSQDTELLFCFLFLFLCLTMMNESWGRVNASEFGSVKGQTRRQLAVLHTNWGLQMTAHTGPVSSLIKASAILSTNSFNKYLHINICV